MSDIALSAYKFKVGYSHDPETGKYTFVLIERGGPVITADSVKEGKLKMEDAISVAMAVRNLAFFHDFGLRTSARMHQRRRTTYVELKPNAVA